MQGFEPPRSSHTDGHQQTEGQIFDIAGVGRCLLPREFTTFTGRIDSIEVIDARESPREIGARLAKGAAIALTGPYIYIDAVYRYCQHFGRRLITGGEFAHIADDIQRRAAVTQARRQKLHRLLLMAQADRLLNVQDSPDTKGLQEWLQKGTGDARFLIPLRRLQRILTDMRRAREGVAIRALNDTITIMPHVYVPADESVPAMFVEYGHLIRGKYVLDMGTGTGVLALLAARLGAARVLATDINPMAVANARKNITRLGLTDRIEVRGPANLFDAFQGEIFDTILFNAPWIEGEPQTRYDTALYDPGYRILNDFLRDAPKHLTPDGAILLQYSDVSQRVGQAGMNNLYAVIAANTLRIASRRSITRISRVLASRERVFLFEIRTA